MNRSPNPPINLRLAIWTRIRNECAAEISACFAAVKAHENVIADLSLRSLLPGQARVMLEHLTQNRLADPSPDKLEAHARILSGLQAIAANDSVQREARYQANDLFLKIGPPLLAMEDAACASIDRQISELEDAEREFFESYGLPREETALMLTAVAVKAALRENPYASGEAQINRPNVDYVPRISIASFPEYFRGMA
jgi:hypothetical protein